MRDPLLGLIVITILLVSLFFGAVYDIKSKTEIHIPTCKEVKEAYKEVGKELPGVIVCIGE